MEKKKCNFCSRSKKKFTKYTLIGAYVTTLMVWGQIEVFKALWHLITSLL